MIFNFIIIIIFKTGTGVPGRVDPGTVGVSVWSVEEGVDESERKYGNRGE